MINFLLNKRSLKIFSEKEVSVIPQDHFGK